jgi:hypothetical protein
MGDHRRSLRFRGDEFSVEILETSMDRSFIESREEYWINELDTYNNGLNETWSGKGSGHNSPKFTTAGYVYSDESRKKMSESAKKRVDKVKLAKISADMWADPVMRQHHSDIRKGKRLRKPKLSDEQVNNIRDLYTLTLSELEQECEVINTARHKKNKSWPATNTATLFANKYKDKYDVSNTLLRGIVLWKTRTKICPMINS